MGPLQAVALTNLICINADSLPRFAEQVGPEFFEGRYSIGVWWWETSFFPPSMYRAFDLVDEIWVGSEFVRAAIGCHTSKPVVRLSLPISMPEPPARTRQELDLPKGFLFLFAFDFLSVLERKNPLGVIEAFRRAFDHQEGPQLVVKSINGDRRLLELEQVRAAAAGRTDIHVIDRYYPPTDKAALIASADCFVSLHRSEGYGLLLAEAMWLGKPVIATAYGGNLDFMSNETSYLVPYRLVPVGETSPPYPPQAEWADPDLDEASRLMRLVYENQAEALATGRRASLSIRETHSPERASSLIAARLAEIRSTRRHQPPISDARGPRIHATSMAEQNRRCDALVVAHGNAFRRHGLVGLVG